MPWLLLLAVELLAQAVQLQAVPVRHAHPLPALASPEEAEANLRGIVAELERDYPSAAACLAEDLPALCVHLRYPLHLRRRLRSTNLLARSVGEAQRRVKVIGRFPGESSCLSLCWAVLDLVIAGARSLGLSDLDRQEVRRRREERQMLLTKAARSA